MTQARELSHLRPQEPTCNQGIMSESPQSLAEWLTGEVGWGGGQEWAADPGEEMKWHSCPGQSGPVRGGSLHRN